MPLYRVFDIDRGLKQRGSYFLFPAMQVQSVASFCGTFLGTAVRIPCEVLKQRLQAGLFDNVRQAIVETWKQDGLKGFFRGTGATLFREVPFYVAGTALYAESKKVRSLHENIVVFSTFTIAYEHLIHQYMQCSWVLSNMHTLKSTLNMIQ